LETEFQFKTISKPGESIYREKGSRFIGYCFPVTSTTEIKNVLESLKVQHPDSRHVCYAYVLRANGKEERSSDDGEPAGTAGKPILNQIYSSDCENMLVAVIRYFGGVKLGTSGLIHAYKTAAAQAIENTEIITCEIQEFFSITFPFHLEGKVTSLVKKFRMQILSKEFQSQGHIRVSVPLSEAETAYAEFSNLYEVDVKKG